MSDGPRRAAKVVIIGGGPAGLEAATALAPLVNGDVVVLDREPQAGGIPRHSDHRGYGIRDLRTFMSGPAYARRLVDRAQAAGARISTNAMVTGWAEPPSAEVPGWSEPHPAEIPGWADPPPTELPGWAGLHSVEVTSPDGRYRLDAEAVVLATGARERPRAARLIPGDRPAGIFTTGALQNLVHLHHGRPGRRAVVVGAELVSWSAVMTLRAAGARTVLMTTRHASPESYALFAIPGRLALRVPVATRTRVVRIIGRDQVEGVEVEELDSGRRRVVACDTVVFTGDWIPDHELARAAGLRIDPGTLGPLVDTAQRTSTPGIFAAGNLVHPVDTADVAALDGRHVAAAVIEYLGHRRPDPRALRLVARAPFRWITPGLWRPGDPAPPRERLLLWTDRLVRVPEVAVTQDGRQLTRRRLPWAASPGRVFRIPWNLLAGVDPDGGDIEVSLVGGG